MQLSGSQSVDSILYTWTTGSHHIHDSTPAPLKHSVQTSVASGKGKGTSHSVVISSFIKKYIKMHFHVKVKVKM